MVDADRRRDAEIVGHHSVDRLAEISDAAAKRRAVIEALPEVAARATALAELEQAEAVVDEMNTALAGASAFGVN